MINQKKAPSKKKGYLIIGFAVLAFLMIWVIADADDGTSSEPENVKTTTISLEQKLKNNIKGIDSLGKSDALLESMDGIKIQLALFKSYSALVNEADVSKNKDDLKLASQMKSKLSALQLDALPKMRKTYVKEAAEKMWEHDVYVTVSGKRNTIIELVGGIYASNKNIKDSQEALIEMLSELRFKQSRYRWYKSQDEYTYYDTEAKKDGELY